MQKELKADLIDGRFTAEDARELLMDLFSKKANFHEVRNFSANERFGKDDPHHLQRIDVLTRNMEQINAFFGELLAKGKQVRIHSVVNIEVSEAE